MHEDHFYSTRRRFLTLSSATLLGFIPVCGYAKIIQKLEGKVWVNEQQAELTTPIKPGDTITTGADSQIVFIIGEDVYHLGAHSRLRLRWHEDNRFVGLMHLVSGVFMGVFGAGEKEIQTPAATIGIRGTGFFFNIHPESTYFCTCYGKTEIVTTGEQPQHQQVQASHHKAYHIAHDKPIITPAEMRDHSDKELVYLESLVGRKAPPGFK